VKAAVEAMEADSCRGLTHAEARRRLLLHGHNELPEAKSDPRWLRFLAQFQQVVILLLLGAAIISGLLEELADTVAIVAIVVLNALLGFLQEERAQRALSAMRKLAAPTSRVLREGSLTALLARELVPGDIIELEAGDRIPADCRLIGGFGLRVQESALTGESEPVDKDHLAISGTLAGLADRPNMVHMGTVVAAGRSVAVVTATGIETELGRIAGRIEHHKPDPTPLQRKLNELGKLLVGVCMAAVVFIFSLQLLRGG
jgi:Ca2+-transporting ATPase